jgi:hypothetical protein
LRGREVKSSGRRENSERKNRSKRETETETQLKHEYGIIKSEVITVEKNKVQREQQTRMRSSAFSRSSLLLNVSPLITFKTQDCHTSEQMHQLMPQE